MGEPLIVSGDEKLSLDLTKQDLKDILHHIWDSRHTSKDEKILIHKLKLTLEKFK